MGTPQIIWFIIAIIDIIYTGIHHGERKTNDRYNFWTNLIAIIIEYFFFKWGGFFK